MDATASKPATYEEILEIMRSDSHSKCGKINYECRRMNWLIALEASAKAGVPKCQWFFGICCQEGIGVCRSKVMSRRIFEAGSMAGCTRCMAELLRMNCLHQSFGDLFVGGDNYAKGVVCFYSGTWGDYKQHWKAQIDADGDPIVCYRLGKSIINLGTSVNVDTADYAWELIKRSADAGYALAQCTYYVGGNDALDYLYRAAYQGYPRAINILYEVLCRGKRYLAALYWYKFAWAANYNKFRLGITPMDIAILDRAEQYQAAVVLVLCGRWYDEGCLLRGLPKDIVRMIGREILRAFV